MRKDKPGVKNLPLLKIDITQVLKLRYGKAVVEGSVALIANRNLKFLKIPIFDSADTDTGQSNFLLLFL